MSDQKGIVFGCPQCNGTVCQSKAGVTIMRWDSGDAYAQCRECHCYIKMEDVIVKIGEPKHGKSRPANVGEGN